MNKALGMAFIYLGIGALVLGVLVYAGALNWLGRLPGDVRIETGRVRVYFPLTTMVLLSALFSLVAWVVRRLQ
jgi:hypothetical protein